MDQPEHAAGRLLAGQSPARRGGIRRPPAAPGPGGM